ncbi:uncharacterized protein LOC121247381 [Juglans microcarpa x Juglans regia]|uniref:uncharacterized protein LOC121247381 n=1 Tax=Juglans microcarpa x Juglans regia TaxID=2249226 RepID=UPI001B7E8EF7|nr:uncharacterized protein LOC121247381 [Juglans microcarpa x Juglans regia]
MEKAYDHVNWSFLLYLLGRCGFGGKWHKWVEFCISSARFSILVNGSPVGFFNSSCGLRQGDPLSPLLFLFVMEALSKMIQGLVDGGLLHGFSVGNDNLNISHLLFADDTLIFCGAHLGQVQALRALLLCVAVVSGFEHQPCKVRNSASGACPDVEILATTLGCKISSLPMKYLGLPLGASFKSERIWNDEVERVECRLVAWKRLYLLKGGDGSRVPFWVDIWCGNFCLRDTFPIIFALARVKEASIVELLVFSNGTPQWNIDFITAAHDWELESITEFFATLYSASILGGTGDKMLWNHSKKCIFFVSSFDQMLTNSGLSMFLWKSIWKTKAPSKATFFVWTTSLDKILTTDNLRKRRVIVLDCCMCKKHGESVDRLLLHCEVAKVIWDDFFSRVGLSWVMLVDWWISLQAGEDYTAILR